MIGAGSGSLLCAVYGLRDALLLGGKYTIVVWFDILSGDHELLALFVCSSL